MRLRTILAAAFALLALALTLAGSLAVQQLASTRLRDRIGGEMAGLASQIRTLLDATLYERLSDMQVLARIATTAPINRADHRAWINALQTAYPHYAWIGFADHDGRVSASAGGMLEGISVAARPWFQEALKGPHVGDVHEAMLLAKLLPPLPSGEPHRFVDVAAPVRSATGEPVGVVGGHLSWNWAEQVAENTLNAATARHAGMKALVLSKNGTVLLGPRDLQGTRLGGDTERLEPSQAQSHGLETWPDGQTYLVGASRSEKLGDYAGLGWTILVTRPAESAFAPARRLSLEIAGGGAAIAVVFAVIGWFAAGWITGPLLALTRTAQAIDRGHSREVRLRPRGATEIRQLTDTLSGLLARVAERDLALETANRTLEAQVTERTRALAESRASLEVQADALRHARDTADAARLEAERASAAKTDFLAAMSHEIRTPLNAVIGFTDLLATSEGLEPGLRRHAQRAGTAGSALLTVVNDILDFSKVEAGAITLEPRAFDIHGLIDDCLSIVRGPAEEKGLTLRAEIDSGLPGSLLGDEARLRQILLNLLNNAVKFTRTGSVTLRLRHEGNVARDGAAIAGTGATLACLRFSVIDTGIGIPRGKQHRLFERFSQVDNSVTRDFGGTGLGLAICKRLVELMGGAIGVESGDGAGSTFWFTLQLAQTASVPSRLVADPRPGPRRTGHLLLVEDVEINQELARLVLEAAGHRVDVVGDGAAAVRAVETGAFDLVLMDVQMPGMDGMTATRMIRRLKGACRHVPVIAMTANVLPSEIRQFREAGMDDHIGKPFDRLKLYAAIETWLAVTADTRAPRLSA